MVLFILFTLITCERWKDVSGLQERILAKVNGEVITERDFAEFLKAQGIDITEESDDALRKSLLDQIIEERLILLEAKRLGIEVSNEEVKLAIELNKESDPQVKWENRIDRDTYMKRLKYSLLLDKIIHLVVERYGEVSDKEALSYYNENREDFKRTEEVRALHIVVATEEEARKLLGRLRKGNEDFKKIAREFSLSPDGKTGGDLGFFSRGEMPEEFEKVVFSLKVGELSSVVKSPYGYHIFKVVDRKKSGIPDFSHVKDEIKLKLRSEKEDRAFRLWLMNLRKKADIEVYNP